MSDTNAAAGQWPEDIAVIEWAKIHCPELEYADLHPLSKAVTAYRIEVQKENATLRAQLSEARARLAEIERQRPVAHVRYNKAGGNAGIAWRAESTGIMVRDGEPLYAAPVSPAAPSLNEPQYYCASCRYVGFTTSELESHGGTCPMCNDGDHIFEFTSWPPHVLPEAPVPPAAQAARLCGDYPEHQEWIDDGMPCPACAAEEEKAAQVAQAAADDVVTLHISDLRSLTFSMDGRARLEAMLAAAQQQKEWE